MLSLGDRARWDEFYTDSRISCWGERFPVHKLALSVAPPVFKAALTNPSPKPSTIIEMDDFSPPVVQAMIDHIYLGQYNERAVNELMELYPLPAGRLSLHLGLFAVGNRYQLEGLKHEATQKYLSAIREKKMSDKAVIATIREVYDEKTAAGPLFKGTVVNLIRGAPGPKTSLLDDASPLRSLLEDCHELARDLAISFLERPVTGQCQGTPHKGSCKDGPVDGRICSLCGGGVAEAAISDIHRGTANGHA